MNGALPILIDSGKRGSLHVQGICLDQERKYIYYSFTTSLVKTDLNGNLIGSVTEMTGHLGCIAMNPADGKVYGSYECKNDVIGRGILSTLGIEAESEEDSFYLAVFDAEKITRPNMHAYEDGIMKTVYLREVVEDYHAHVINQGKTYEHRYGCSGIDGITFAPIPGTKSSFSLFVAYGIYDDQSRTDNDYQVLLNYDVDHIVSFLQPMNLVSRHREGPEKPDNKFFVYTGNTDWGVQNLEYDPYTGNIFMCVYRGHKPNFPNHYLYVIDGSKAPVLETLKGVIPEKKGYCLSLWGDGAFPGFDFPYGSTGICSLGDGRFYISKNARDPDGEQRSLVSLYRYSETLPQLFEKI